MILTSFGRLRSITVGGDFFDALYQNTIASIGMKTRWDGSVELHVGGPGAGAAVVAKLRGLSVKPLDQGWETTVHQQRKKPGSWRYVVAAIATGLPPVTRL